jgi:hypothetical protein
MTQSLGNRHIKYKACTYFSLCCAVFVDGSAMSMGCSSGLINNLRLKCGTSQVDSKRQRNKCLIHITEPTTTTTTTT